MNTIGDKAVAAFQTGGLAGLGLLLAFLMMLIMASVILSQQRQIKALVGQLISLSSTTGNALASTASSLTGLTDAVRENGAKIDAVNMRGARLESEITHVVERP